MRAFFYVYVLVSQENKTIRYTGVTRDLDQRLREHNRGACPHTSKHRPWRIETAVAFKSESKARAFEKYLKGGSGTSSLAVISDFRVRVRRRLLNRIPDSARFFPTTDFLTAREILRNRRIEWVLAYDWKRVAQNSSGLVGTPVPNNSIGRILDRTPGQASPFLVLSDQNQTAKLFRFADKL